MVNQEARDQNAHMTQDRGWISYGSGRISHLTEEQWQLAEERIRRRQEQRGGLLGVVEVRVYENGCEPQVSFPAEAKLGIETDARVISDMVARARDTLTEWR
jgi:hypothetical protein